MRKKSIMVQGTASSVGKSIICAALCRILTQDGNTVAPFKSQNMSLNSYITHEGHEMGRAQVMQAEACNKAPIVQMNPILLKPTTDRKSQVVLNGIVAEHMDATEYFKFKPRLKEMVKDTYNKLLQENDVMVIEGAGSPAEINLKSQDIVNMGMAEIASSPVLLVADIDKGGVFASIYGTIMLLEEKERKRVKGIIINKFRGSVELLKPGLKQIEKLVNVPVLGVVPYFNLNIEDEDSVTDWDKFTDNQQGDLEVVIIKLPKMSNFTDFNALRLHGDVKLRFIDIHQSLGNPDLIIIPGSKSTISDLEALKESNMAEQITKAHQRGTHVLGICGGYQMLGKYIIDEFGAESNVPKIEGLGLLPLLTEFGKEKITTLSEGIDTIFGRNIKGYEIHMGKTKALEDINPLVKISKRNGFNYTPADDGAVNSSMTVYGTYLHGIFDNGDFTRRLLNHVRLSRGKKTIEQAVENYWDFKEKEYDKLADIVRGNIDMQLLNKIIEEGLND